MAQVVQVQCYAGRKADERPVRFRGGPCDCMVEEIIDRWYGPDASFFKVRADDGNLYVLCHHMAADLWTMDFGPKPARDLPEFD